MAGSNQLKLKLLYLKKILSEQTDEDNPLSANELVEKLNLYGIIAERKSIYADIKLLEEFGLDICRSFSKKRGYFIGTHDFELPELRLLVDAIQSARFITQKKSRELIKKIERLTSKNQAKNLERQIFIEDRLKCQNEEIYYNIDKIHQAISISKKISFQYYQYDINKDKKLKDSGKLYIISPYAMTWFDDHYYLVGNNDRYNNLSHYRIDRMCNIIITEQGVRNFTEVSDYKYYFNTADYSKRLYNMFPGETEKVKIKFKNHLINAVLDRFGMDVTITKENEGEFCVIADLVVSDGFLAWLLIFGEDAKIIAPDNLIKKMQDKIRKIYALYG